MAHFTIPWRTSLLFLVYISTLEMSCSLEANSSSGAQIHLNVSDNFSDYAPPQVSPPILRENYSGIGLSLKVIRSAKAPPTSKNSIDLDDFQFVDSPEKPAPNDSFEVAAVVSPEKTAANDSFEVGAQLMHQGSGRIHQDRRRYRTSKTTKGSNKGRIHVVGSGGTVEKDYWKGYPNGTIIHDVRISLVHPANMGILGKGAFSGVEWDESSSDPHLSNSNEGRIPLDSSVGNNSDSYRISSTAIEDLWGYSSTAADYNSTAADYNSAAVDYNSTAADYDSTVADYNSTAFDCNFTAVGEAESNKSGTRAGGQTSLQGKLPSVINLGISINAKGLCMSECLAKCAASKSNSSEIPPPKVPVCPSNSSHPTFVPPTAEKLGITADSTTVDNSTVPDEADDSTASVPVLRIGESREVNSSHPTFVPPTTEKLGRTTDSTTVDNATVTDEADDSKASVPVLLIGESREDFLDNGSSVDLEDDQDVELRKLKSKELLEPKPKFLLEEVCLSEKCVLKSADLLRRIDKSADPCNSFYNFACGSYLKNEIPTRAWSRSIFSDISSDNVARMYSVLKSPIAAGDRLYIKVLKRFYKKCSLSSPSDLFAEVVEELGGWPSPYSPAPRVPKNVWGEIAFNWTFGMFLEYNLVSINLTYSNTSTKWILNVDYPQFVKVALVSNSFYDLSEIERDLKIVANALGIDSSTTTAVLMDLRIFMASAIKYAKATMFDAERGLYSLKFLRAKFSHLDVFRELPALLKAVVAIDEDEMIRVGNMGYLLKIDELLRDSPVRTQANHLVLNALRVLSVLIGMSDDDSREKYCVKLTGKLFPRLVGHLHSSTLVSDSQVASAAKIVSRIQDSLLSWLNDSISENTIKEKAIEKVRKLVFIWNNRNELNDDITGIAESFDENTSFSHFVKSGIWNFKKATYAYLHRRVNDSVTSFVERYSGDGYSVNAYYFLNHISIPPSALHESIFNSNVPPYVSFGGLGLIVGHELIHSVLAVDELLNSISYINMGKCMVNRFNSFPKKFFGDGGRGGIKKEENIADYGGFKVAYRAFSEWYTHFSNESKEKRLPGLQTFNEKQMFWLTAAANWCRKISPGFTASSVDKHAPPEYRVDGIFANIPEFAEDFNCPVDSPMNPEEKCTLW